MTYEKKDLKLNYYSNSNCVLERMKIYMKKLGIIVKNFLQNNDKIYNIK